MPYFAGFPFPRRHNSLRLLGYDYNSINQLCAITLVTDLRRPLFADLNLAKALLVSLLSEQTMRLMRVRAFTLLPDHMHFLAVVRQPQQYLPSLIGQFKSYTTQLYWQRSQEIVKTGVYLPPKSVTKAERQEARRILASLMEWRATLRPEMVELRKWPALKASQFLKKRLCRRVSSST